MTSAHGEEPLHTVGIFLNLKKSTVAFLLSLHVNNAYKIMIGSYFDKHMLLRANNIIGKVQTSC